MIQSPFIYVVALICALLGLLMPFLEFIPATSAVTAVPVAAFGLGITMHDGAFVIIGFIALLAMVGVAIALGSAAT